MMGRRRLPWLALAALLAVAVTPAAAKAAERAGPSLSFVFVAAPGVSPVFEAMGVATALRERGHAVTVVTTDADLAFARRAAARASSNTTAEALTWLTVPLPRDAVTLGGIIGGGPNGSASPVLHALRSPLSVFKMVGLLRSALAAPCAALLADAGLVERLRGLRPDAVFALTFPIGGDACGCVLGHLLGVPHIDLNPNPLVYGPLSTPQFPLGLSSEELRTPAGYLKNLAAWTAKQVLPPLLLDFGPSPWRALRAAHGLPRASGMCPLSNALARARGIKSRACKPLLEVLMTSWAIEHARPLQPHEVIVGPGCAQPARPIEPPEVAEFVEAARDGLVLAAFGSTEQSRVLLQRQDVVELAHGFAALAPVRVLWAVKEQHLPPGASLADLQAGENIRIVPWVPQNDVLGHRHTRAFISHCGIHSSIETAFHGVPVVALPFQFEQAANCRRLAAKGLGVVSSQAPGVVGPRDAPTFTRRGVAALVRQVLDNPSYADAARSVSRALQTYAARRHPNERAADEIELALLSQRAAAAAAAGSERQAGAAVASAAEQQEL